MHTKSLVKTGLVALAIGIAQQAAAITIYSVTSTPTINCGSAPHGLWTNTYNSSSCNEYYDFQDGSKLTVDGAEATLSATALNGSNVLATIDILFGGFADTYDVYKNGGTPDYNGTDNPVDWDFYSYIISGSISFSNGDSFQALLVAQPGAGVASPDKPVLQIGDGANDKSSGFGASAWLDIYDDNGSPVYTGGAHWDLNMSLAIDPPQPPSSVPVPTPLTLLGLGLVGMFATRRRRH